MNLHNSAVLVADYGLLGAAGTPQYDTKDAAPQISHRGAVFHEVKSSAEEKVRC